MGLIDDLVVFIVVDGPLDGASVDAGRYGVTDLVGLDAAVLEGHILVLIDVAPLDGNMLALGGHVVDAEIDIPLALLSCICDTGHRAAQHQQGNADNREAKNALGPSYGTPVKLVFPVWFRRSWRPVIPDRGAGGEGE